MDAVLVCCFNLLSLDDLLCGNASLPGFAEPRGVFVFPRLLADSARFALASSSS